MAQQIPLEEMAARAARRISAGSVTFVAGAGVSMSAPAHLPGWKEMMRAILQELAGPTHQDEVALFEPFMEYLFNEVVLRKISQRLGSNEPAAEMLRGCLSFADANAAQHQIVAIAGRFGAGVLTMNFDMLFENAAAAAGVSLEMLKLHGSLDRLDEARFTVERVLSPLDDILAQPAAEMLQRRPCVIIAGYNGQDDFDVMPLLFGLDASGAIDNGPVQEVLWLVHSPDGAAPLPANPPFRHSKRLRWCAADTDLFWSQLSRKLQLQPDLPAAKPQSPGWWREGVARWGKMLRRRWPSQTRLLWAELLDDMRIYRGGPHKHPNPAENAYHRAADRLPPDSVDAFFARSQVAVMRQRLNQGERRAYIKLREEMRLFMRKQLTQPDPLAPGDLLRLRTLYAQVVYAEAKLAQNADFHAEADLLFQETQELFLMLGSSEAYGALFLEFMNASQSANKGLSDIDQFAPPRWRNWLAQDLERAARRMQAEHDYGAFAATIHNAAYVHQVRGEEEAREEKHQAALATFAAAITYYEEGFRYRLRLRDPRGLSQSRYRICQCALGEAQALLALGRKREIHARLQLRQVDEHMREVAAHYAQIPHERLRHRDLEGIMQGLKEIRGLLLPKHRS
jgi:hypothetical protein